MKQPEGSENHILVDEHVIKTMVETCEIKKDETVLEIGGGSGKITEKIVSLARKVFVIEKNHKYVEILNKKFKSVDNVIIMEGNVLDMELPSSDKIISNLPFSISEPFFFKIMKERYRFSSSVFILPHGFVKKMTTPLSSPFFGVVSALFLGFYEVDIVEKILPGAFYPPPQTDSYCVKVTPKVVAPSQETRGLYLLQRIFLLNEKKVRNVFVETLWALGLELTGNPLTRKEVISLMYNVFGGEFHSFSRKKLAHLSNEDMRKAVHSVMSWQIPDDPSKW